ncbi:NAC domain-containing protein 67-like [Rhododendron vialii]|uniref:NAC domain-containing protein 67-like n=1 Tax=Rhododendron vialii TaxID=182163 RepID=UPI00265F7542|nr:NAC domain-containing protein 67-like [Rhododendron vialii]
MDTNLIEKPVMDAGKPPELINKSVDHKDQVVGHKKVLVYYEGKLGRENSKKTNWIMHEFRVEGPPRIKESQHDMKLDDWVLCRIYRKEVSENGKKGEAQGQVPERWKKGGVQAQHKLVPIPSPAANDNDLDDLDTDGLFAQNSNPAPSQNSDNVPV